MTLQFEKFYVRHVDFGSETRLTDGTLSIDRASLCEHLQQKDARIKSIRAHVARPGDSTRIVCVKDAIEPRVKVNGDRTGEGAVRSMKNVAVLTCGRIVAYQEGIVDMSGPGAPYTPFSETHNVVLEIDVEDGLPAHQHEETVRLAGLEAASYIAGACSGLEPDETETFNNWPAEGLPRIAYVYMLLSQGLLHDTYVEGVNAASGLPRSVEPQFVLDNGIHSGNCVSACDKNTTWHHQNNPVIFELLGRHGDSLDFAGVVLTNEPTKLPEKKTSATAAIELAKQLRAEGAVVTEEGFGNPEADLMMIVRGLEEAGIRTVCITDEYAGSDGASQSLADTTPEADAIVTAGNANELLTLPPMDLIIGPLDSITELAGAYPQSLGPDGSLTLEIQGIVGATNELGERTLRCREV